jgi:hypothetical protein
MGGRVVWMALQVRGGRVGSLPEPPPPDLGLVSHQSPPGVLGLVAVAGPVGPADQDVLHAVALRPGTAALRLAWQPYLVDHVLPVAPLRQWTVSLTREVRGLLAFSPDVLNDVSHALTRTLDHGQRDRLPDDIRRHLAHLGLPTELPRAARARAPPAQAV